MLAPGGEVVASGVVPTAVKAIDDAKLARCVVAADRVGPAGGAGVMARQRTTEPERYCKAQVACEGARLVRTQHDDCLACRTALPRRARPAPGLRGERVKLSARERREVMG